MKISRFLLLAFIGGFSCCFADVCEKPCQQKTCGQKVDDAIDYAKGKYYEIKDEAQDKYHDVKDDLKDRYYEAKDKAKSKYYETKAKVREKLREDDKSK